MDDVTRRSRIQPPSTEGCPLPGAQRPHPAAGQSRERVMGAAPTWEPSSTAERCAVPCRAGPQRHRVACGPSPGTGGRGSSPSPQVQRRHLRWPLPQDIPSHPTLPAHPRHRDATPAGEGVPAEHGRVTEPVGTQQEQRGHTVSQPHPGCPGHQHTYIFSMSSFSSKAPGRSRLFPRTRTCRTGEGTPEAPGHQTRREPASATQKWTLLEMQDSPGHFTRVCPDEENPFSGQSEGRALQLTALISPYTASPVYSLVPVRSWPHSTSSLKGTSISRAI